MRSIDFALVFCGGKGTRLGHIGKKKNKSMLLVNRKPIIFYIVSTLIKANVNKIIFPLGYKGETIKNYLKKKFSNEIHRFIFINTGVNSTISKRVSIVKKNISKNKNILLLNGDTIIKFDLLKIFKQYNKKPIACIFSKKIDLGFFYKKNNNYTFIKKSFINNFISEKKSFSAYSGIVLFNTNILFSLNLNKNNNFEEMLFRKILENNNITIHNIKENCFPIDNLKDLEYANLNINKISNFK